MGSAGLLGGTISHIQGGGFIKGGVIAAPAGFIGGGASSLASTLLARAGVSGLAGAIAADGFGGAAAGAADSQLRGNTLAKTVQAALYGFVAGGLLRAGLSCAGPWIQASWTRLLNRTPKRVDPRPVPSLPKFVEGAKTSGVLRVGDSDVPLLSGKAGPGGTLPKPAPGFNAITSTHVEGHAAAMMRQQGIKEATLYINNSKICLPCRQNIEHMLPSGSKLTIVLPDGTTVTYLGNAR
jgi:hypothetical protein